MAPFVINLKTSFRQILRICSREIRICNKVVRFTHNPPETGANFSGHSFPTRNDSRYFLRTFLWNWVLSICKRSVEILIRNSGNKRMNLWRLSVSAHRNPDLLVITKCILFTYSLLGVLCALLIQMIIK